MQQPPHVLVISCHGIGCHGCVDRPHVNSVYFDIDDSLMIVTTNDHDLPKVSLADETYHITILI